MNMKRLLIVILLVFACFLMADEIAIFTKIQGQIYSEVDSTKIIYQIGDVIENNTTIYSETDSYALVHYKFTNGTLRVFPNSAVNIVSIDSLNTKVTLTSGKILNDLNEKITGSYTVETNSTVASVRGTAFEVFLTEEGTDINVVDGNVDVLNKMSGLTHSLKANQRLLSKNSGELIELTAEGNPLPNEDEPEEIEDSSNNNTGQSSSGGFKLPSLALPSSPSSSQDVIINKPAKEEKKKEEPAKQVVKDKSELVKLDQNSFPIAIVLKIKGDLTLIRDSKELKCSVGTRLENKDIVRTNDNSLALIKFVDNSSQIRVFSNSEVLINAEQDREVLNKNLKLEDGSILSKVNSKITGKYSVSTTSTIASVRGTEFLVELTDGITKVTGFSGKVEVENVKTGEKMLVTKGDTVTSTGEGKIDRQKTEKIPEEVNEELQETETDNTMRIQFENEEGAIKTIILEF